MWAVWGVLVKELVTVGQMVLCAAGRRCVGRLDALGAVHLQRAIHFVGAYVVESLALIFLWQRLPVLLGSL